jgi:RNA polymerase sigma-70 factor (ECF subfamily)
MQPVPSKLAVPAGDAGAGAAEDAVLARARGGDRAAFGDLIDRHQDRVFALSLHLCRGNRDDAEELAQEAFLRALEAIEGFRGDAAFSTWIHRIVVNLHLNRSSTLAARARRSQLSLATQAAAIEEARAIDPPDREAAPPESAAAAEERGELHRALAALDEDRRVAVVLRDVEGLSYEEIAALLRVPIGTVRSRLARGREELSRRLGGCGFRGGELPR